MLKFPHYKQHDQMDCGPTCLRMIARHHGRSFSIQKLRELCEISREGVSLLGISEAAEKVGFRSLGVKLNLEQLKASELPCILHWLQNHFVVLYRIRNGRFYVADPAKGLVSFSEEEFIQNWLVAKELYGGISLLLSPTPQFYEQEDDKGSEISWSFLLRYLSSYRKLVIQLFFGLGIGSLLQLITPFLTQSAVDIGINTRNLSFNLPDSYCAGNAFPGQYQR